jgi:hypothetical protein
LLAQFFFCRTTQSLYFQAAKQVRGGLSGHGTTK